MSRPIRTALLASASWACLIGTGMAQELPTGGTVAQGDVNIGATGPGSMTLTQGSNSAVVNWQSFSIGSGGQVDIRQPNADASMLNRVTGAETSEIHGRLTANGQVHLVNPNGIFIGPNGTVEAGGFVASTLDITDEDFMAGRLRYRGLGSSATVENAGRVTIGRDGYAALLGGRVKNSGVVTVPMGRIAFGSGERAVLDLSGDQFLQVMVPTGGEDGGEDGDAALIEHSGLASAEGGLIEMRAATAREAVRHAINLDGVAEARSVSMSNGAIVLGGGSGGTVNVSGRVSTRSAPSALIVEQSKRPPTGPGITVTGQRIRLAGAQIDASGTGGGGLIRIGGDFAGAGDLPRADTVEIDGATSISADALGQGDGGRIAIWSDVSTEYAGFAAARGGDGGGDGGFIEVSSKQTLGYGGVTDTRAPQGAWGWTLLDPTNITINTGAGETSLETSLNLGNWILDTSSTASDSGNISINADIDWAAATTLTLDADNDIFINGALNAAAGSVQMFALGDVVLDAPVNAAAGTVLIDSGGTIQSGSSLGLDITATDLTFQGDTLLLGNSGTSWSIAASSTVSVDVNSFDLQGGTWATDNTASTFSANDFRIDQFSSSFQRTAGGTGMPGDPYRIFDIYGLQGISTYGPDFVLANDIDGSVTSGWTNASGSGFEPILDFTGTLDGGGFTVSNLYQDGTAPAGLFDLIDSSGSVRGLTLANADVTGSEGGILANVNIGTISTSSVSGTLATDGFNTGGMVGTNFGTIEDSMADVTVNATGSSGFDNIGGFVGLNNSALIERSHALGDVTVVASGSPTSVDMGGFVGEESAFMPGTINDSYARGDVTFVSNIGSAASVNAGGFAGVVDGSINNSYSTGQVSVSGNPIQVVGGFAGQLSSFGSGSGNFWDTQTSGLGSSVLATGLTTAQFQNTATFTSLAGSAGWTFGTVWAPGSPGTYPANPSTSPVIVADPNNFTVQYGQTSSATTTGTISGGPSAFAFGPGGDTVDISGLFTSLSFPDGDDAGIRSFGLNTTSLTSASGVVYSVVALPGQATITQAPLLVTPNDQTKIAGTTFTFSGTEFTTSGFADPGDRITSASFFSLGSPASAPVGSYSIRLSGLTGIGLDNYVITDGTGTMDVVPSDENNPRPPVVVIPGLPNPTDIFDGEITLDIVGALSQLGGGQAAAEAFAQVQGISGSLQIAADSCGQSSGDVGRYLACVSDALNDFAGELDAISLELPPGMENVAQIIQTARTQIDGAATRAAARLANATTEAERQAIRRDAAIEARAALDNASNEIRKAITLVRAEDPELASLQRATITTVADAVDTVGIELARVTDL